MDAKVTAENGQYFWSHPDHDAGKPQGPSVGPLEAAQSATDAGYNVEPWDLDADSLKAADAEIQQEMQQEAGQLG